MGRGMKILEQIRESVVAPAIDAVQRNPVTVLTLSALDAARAVSDSPGAAPLHAAYRGGLKDLQDAILPAFPDSMKTREEPGAIGTPTQQLVTEQMTGKLSLDDLRGVARDNAAKAAREMHRSSQDRDLDL